MDTNQRRDNAIIRHFTIRSNGTKKAVKHRDDASTTMRKSQQDQELFGDFDLIKFRTVGKPRTTTQKDQMAARRRLYYNMYDDEIKIRNY